MLRLRYMSWLAIYAVLLSIVAPALPAHAASNTTLPSPLRQDDIVERIAEIRSGEPDLEDDFDNSDTLFQTGYDGTTSAYLKSGELRISVDDENTLAWSTMDQEVSDFYAEVETIHREGSLDNQFGFLARFDEDDNYYLFAASSDGYYTIQLFEDGEWEAIVEWGESDTIDVDEGALNTLGLLAEGDTYSLLINDTIVETITDDALNGTGLALNAAAFDEPPMEMAFDNFRLWYVGDPIEEAPRQAPIDGRVITTEPSDTPTPEGTLEATDEPTPEETAEPTAEATEEVTPEATPEETAEPTEEPTAEPTEEATVEPTVATGSSSDPVIAAIQGQPATFSDDFEDGDSSDWVAFPSESVTYEVVDGALEFVFNTPNVLSWSELPATPSRYYLEVDATLASPLEAAEYGIIFNYEDSQNFYLYAINNESRYSVWRLVNNAWEMVADWVDSTALLSGEGNTNRLGLLLDGTSATLVANDETLTTIEVDEAAGSAALAAGTFEEADLTMSFDNVLLWDLDALEPLPTTEATAEATDEPTPEATEEPTEEPTGEPTDEPVSGDFAEISQRIEEIVASDPDITDDFRRDTGNWLTESDEIGEYYYESRAFNIEASAEDRIVWSTYYEDAEATEPMVLDNFYAEFDTSFATYTGENASGLVFRLVDTDNFYKFLVDEIGYFQLQKRVEGDYSDILEWAITEEVDDSEGAVNRIGILADGSTLALTVNGVVVAQAEDADLDSGGVALAIQTYGTPEGHSIFDNFDLWILD